METIKSREGVIICPKCKVRMPKDTFCHELCLDKDWGGCDYSGGYVDPAIQKKWRIEENCHKLCPDCEYAWRSKYSVIVPVVLITVGLLMGLGVTGWVILSLVIVLIIWANLKRK